jgi:hypothetical protein
MGDVRSTIREVRHIEDPSGISVVVIFYDDGPAQIHEHMTWSGAREMAERAGLEHRDDGPGWTAWSRRR